MNKTEQESENIKRPFYKNLWFRIVALILVASMLFSLWATSAIQISIQKRNEQDAAAQYLIDNTEYIQSDERERLEELLQSMFRAEELADYYKLAGTQIAAGEYEAALENIDKCIELYPGGDEALYIDLMLKRGCLYVLIGQYEPAVEALEEVLLAHPEQADAYLVLAQIYAETGSYHGLVPVLQEYLKLRPEDADIRAVLAQTYFETGEYELAVQEYEILRQSGNMADAQSQILFLEALAYIQLEDYAKSREILTNLDESASELSGRDYYLGVCCLSEEDYESGELHFTAALDAGEMTQLSLYSRAVCRLMKQDFDYEGAVSDLESAVAYDGADKDETITQQARGLLETILTESEEKAGMDNA